MPVYWPGLLSRPTRRRRANYAADSWERERRVIIKAEVVCGEGKEPKENPQFVITNMNQTPQWLYEDVYCQRGDIENRIEKLHALEIDRTSCSWFWANRFRVLLTAGATCSCRSCACVPRAPIVRKLRSGR
jgi:hypothetical protein